MITSMTGYATAAHEIPSGLISLELRSVNNRYLDIQFKLPDEFRTFEAGMRELLNTKIKRGKIDCRLTFQSYPDLNLPQQLNSQVMRQLLDLNNIVQSNFIAARSLGVTEILKWPGILVSDSLPTTDLQEACNHLLQITLNELIATKLREGEKLKAILLDRLNQMRRLASVLSPRIPSLIKNFQEKLILRLQKHKWIAMTTVSGKSSFYLPVKLISMKNYHDSIHISMKSNKHFLKVEQVESVLIS